MLATDQPAVPSCRCEIPKWTSANFIKVIAASPVAVVALIVIFLGPIPLCSTFAARSAAAVKKRVALFLRDQATNLAIAREMNGREKVQRVHYHVDVAETRCQCSG
jgi:flagellar biosynthesis/type III secretory pathway M-ring protein FliF/YscJ